MNTRIYLRALEADDYKTSVNWRNDSEISNLVGGPKYFVSSEREREWVRNAIFDNSKLVLAICIKGTNKYIGNIMLEDIDYVNRSAHVPVFIGDKTEWNKGYATEARMLMLEYAFHQRGLQRIVAYVLESNIASLKMHEKCGYKVEGVLRHSVYKNGVFHNQVMLSILRDEFDVKYREYCEKYK